MQTIKSLKYYKSKYKVNAIYDQKSKENYSIAKNTSLIAIKILIGILLIKSITKFVSN